MTSITGDFETKFRSKEPGIKENPEMEDFFQDFWLGIEEEETKKKKELEQELSTLKKEEAKKKKKLEQELLTLKKESYIDNVHH